MDKRKLAVILLVLLLCVGLVTPAMAAESFCAVSVSSETEAQIPAETDKGCVTLTVSDARGVLLVSIETDDYASDAPVEATMCVPAGMIADVIVVKEAGSQVERWDISVEGITLNDQLTITEMTEVGAMFITYSWFIMPEPAVDIEIVAVISLYEDQPIQTPQLPQTPAGPQPIPTRPAEEISVFVDGIRLDLEVPPYLLDGRTLVPLRAIFEALGASVAWDPEYQIINATKDGTHVLLMIGSNRMFRDGVTSLIDVAPLIADGRTLVPTRLIAESFGATVNWDPETRTVNIISN